MKNLWMVCMASSSIWSVAVKRSVIIWVRWGIFAHTVYTVLPCSVKQETISQPLKVWNIWTCALSGPTANAISLATKKKKALEVPKDIYTSCFSPLPPLGKQDEGRLCEWGSFFLGIASNVRSMKNHAAVSFFVVARS